MTTISVCIPTYEMKGLGKEFLRKNFDMLAIQTHTDFNVIISDHSVTNDIEDLCTEYASTLSIHYYRNEYNRGNSSANINNAIKYADGALIKILFQDDFLYSPTALQEIVQHFDLTKDSWLVTACTHTTDGVHFFRDFYPRYNNHIHLGSNTISSPSVLTIKNTEPLLFDENLIWLMDCEYYKRCHDAFGAPVIVPLVGIVNRVGAHQITNTSATNIVKKREYAYVLQKYEHGLSFWYYRVVGFIKHLIR